MVVTGAWWLCARFRPGVTGAQSKEWTTVIAMGSRWHKRVYVDQRFSLLGAPAVTYSGSCAAWRRSFPCLDFELQ